jgi:hypothetical protein
MRFSDHFAAYLKAKQDLYRSIAENIESGKSLDDAFHPFEGPPMPSNLDLYQGLAKQEARALRRKLGDQAIYETITKAIRKQPFVIHR